MMSVFHPQGCTVTLKQATNCKVIFTCIYIDSSPVKGKEEDSFLRMNSWPLLVLAQREASEMHIYLSTWMTGMRESEAKAT